VFFTPAIYVISGFHPYKIFGLICTLVNFYFFLGIHPSPIQLRGVRGAVWFGFEHKSHPYREIKKHAVWFGSVDF